MPKKPSKEEADAIDRIRNYLIDRGEYDRLEEEALDGRDDLKKRLSLLLDKKDRRYIDVFADDLIKFVKIQSATGPERESLTRNDPASTLDEFEGKQRVLARLREEGVFPPLTDEQKVKIEAEREAIIATEKTTRLAKNFTPDQMQILGIDNASFLANLREPNSPIGNAFREQAAKNLAEKAIGNARHRDAGTAGSPTPKQEMLAEPAKEIPHQQPHASKNKAPSVTGNHIKGGALGVLGAAGAATVEAHKGVGAAINAAAEAVLPGSTTTGHDICKKVGVVAGGVAGTVAAAGVGAGTLTVLTPTASPLVSVPSSVVAGGAAFSVTQPAVSNLTELACNSVLPDSVKQAAGKALQALDSALTFGGDTKVAQNAHKETALKGTGAQR